MLQSSTGVGTVQNNLPQQTTSFIGREQQIEEVRDLLATSRLVTLVGAGGSGKTRLALQVAAGLIASEENGIWEDGVWLVELAGLSDPTFIYEEVARVVGVHERPGWSMPSALVSELEAKHLLLVLDHCEHLAEACGSLADYLLSHCPNVHIVATSREPLNVEDEQIFRVPPLPHSEAVRLFTERAQAAQPSFALTGANTPAVAQLCLRLDGIPLALELAAARMQTLSAQEISTQLDQRFSLAAGGANAPAPPQNVPPPQSTPQTLAERTLALLTGRVRPATSSALPSPVPPLAPQQIVGTTLDWTYGLLTNSEQTFLNRLSVFAGGWILSAAAGICVDGDGINRAMSDQEVLDLLMGLVDKALVVYYAGRDGEQERFWLREPVRQYTGERLSESGETEAVGGRAASWFMGLAEMAAESLNGPEEETWLPVLETEHNNLRASLAWEEQWAASGQDGSVFEHRPRLENGVRLAAALWRFWYRLSCLTEGRRWLESALTRTIPETLGMRDPMEVWQATPARAKGLYGAALLARAQGDRRAEGKWQEQAMMFYHQLGDRKGLAASLTSLGNTAYTRGDNARARGLHEESLKILREIGNPQEIANVVSDLANAAHAQGDLKAARPLFEEALTFWRQIGDSGEVGTMLGNLGNIASAEGDLPAARALYEESVINYREAGNTLWVANVLSNLGRNAHSQGEITAARAYYEESLTVRRQLGRQKDTAAALNALVIVAADQGDYAAARLYAEEGLTLYEQLGDTQEVASSLFSLGELASKQSEFGMSRAFYENCLAVVRQSGDQQSIALLLNILGGVASHQSDHAAARAFYEECRALRRQLGDQENVALVSSSLAAAASDQGDLAAARIYTEEGLALFRQLGDKEDLLASLFVSGQIAFKQGDYAGARALFEEGLSLARQLERPKDIGGLLDNLAATVLAQGDRVLSRTYHEECLPLARQWAPPQELAALLSSLGTAALEQGDLTAARAYYEEGLSIYRQLEDTQNIASHLFALGGLTSEQGDFAAARVFYEE